MRDSKRGGCSKGDSKKEVSYKGEGRQLKKRQLKRRQSSSRQETATRRRQQQGGDSSNQAVVCVDSLAALAVSMAIYGVTCRAAGGYSDDQADGTANTRFGGPRLACRKTVQHIGPADGFGLRR